jgi:hypothetical protein
MMPALKAQDGANVPEYTTTTVGPPDYLNIANRLRSIASFLAAQGMTEAAEHVAKASGCLMATVAAK